MSEYPTVEGVVTKQGTDISALCNTLSEAQGMPAQVMVAPTEVVQYVPGWVGRREHTIHMAHIASVDIKTSLLFANIVIETSGGSDPVHCYGHHKGDAVEIKRLINEYQSAYYKSGGKTS